MNIISNNEKQFKIVEFAEFCAWYSVHKSFLVVAHPPTNGQVEAVNKVMKSIIKKQLWRAKGNWIDELLRALWAYRTT